MDGGNTRRDVLYERKSPAGEGFARAIHQGGLFQDTVGGFLEKVRLQKKLIVHVDCDLYSSTLFVLASLNNYLKPGSLIIFDDFYSLLHEFKAFVDYDRSFGRAWKPLAHVRNCVQTAIQVEK